jgi:thiamine biosynthesis protein ThiS
MIVLSQVQAPLISIWINGQEHHVPAVQSVADLLASLDLPRERLAVELNRSIVRKREWPTTLIQAGSRIEIVEFVGGG